MLRIPFFGKSAPPPIETVMQQTVALLQQGNPVEAEATVLKHLQLVEKQIGKRSSAYSETQAGYAALLRMLGKQQAALSAYEAACAYEPPLSDTAARKDWLTFLTDYGQALEEADRLEEAKDVLQRGIAGRREFYGVSHPGLAFGLEPCAALLMRMERYEEAKAVQEQAVEIFLQSQHPRFVPALALLGAARQATGEQGALLKGIVALPQPAVEQLATEGAELLERFPNRIRQPVLLEIAALVTEHCGATSLARLNLLAQIANNETEAGAEANHEVRLLAARMSYDALKETGDVERIIQGLMGLAYAQTEAGNSADAEDSYRKARLLAEEKADYSLASQVARNHGLALAEQEERERAEPLLRDAIALAERSMDRVMQGRSECALGIFLQHGDRHEEAKPLLEAALEHLPATEADAIYARSHYTALQQGGACGCGQMEGAFFENYCLAIREQVEKEMPGLLKSIAYKGGDDEEAGLQVEINRKPTDQELERLHIVVTQAEAAFRQRMILQG